MPRIYKSKKFYAQNAKRDKSLFSKALTQKQRVQVKKIVGAKIETKYIDVVEGSVTTNIQSTRAGDFYLLTGLAVGDTAQTRTGNRVTPVSLQIRMLTRFFVTGGQASTYWGNPIRVIIFAFDATLGNAGGPNEPIVGNMLEALPAPATSDNYTLPYNHRNRKSYTILYDKIFRNGGQGINFTPHTINVRRLPKKITYTGIGDGEDSIGDNSLYMYVCSAFDPVADTTFGMYTFASRFKFKDA